MANNVTSVSSPDVRERATLTGDANVHERSNENPSPAMVQPCLEVIERRRKGEIATGQAVRELLMLLPDSDAGTQALERYVDMCSDIDSEHAAAKVRGKQVLRPTVQDHGEGTSNQGDLGDDDDPYTSERRPGQRGTKRGHVDSDADEENAKKRPDESLFAWRSDHYTTKTFDPEVILTHKLKANYAIDIKAAKADLTNRPNCPNFPDALWTDVLLCNFINLDKIHGGFYALEPDTKHTQSIGEIDITWNDGSTSSRNSRSIQTHGEWSVAFASARNAILFAFPHRVDELTEYKCYIIGQFSAFELYNHY
jgi:hypothetical protein